MKYILDGNEKDVTNVIKEQRVRMGRGGDFTHPYLQMWAHH